MEATVKALQGMTALAKITSDSEMAAASSDGIEIKFIPSLNTPVEPSEWERILAEKDPTLLKYFGVNNQNKEEKNENEKD